MKFEDLTITNKEVNKYTIRKLRRTFICKKLHAIEKKKLRKYGSSYCASAVYDLMRDRCILMHEGDYETGYDLVLGKKFERMLKIYKRKHGGYFELTRIELFDFISIAYLRGQISEC